VTKSRQKIILDVDTGVDDALAILHALASDDIEVMGITTCFGNVDIHTATRNTLAIVELAGKSVSVYQGAEAPLERTWLGPVPWIHGDNGLGNAYIANPTSSAHATMTAADFIIATVRAYPGEVVIVPVARMTNLAHALQTDGQIAGLIQRVVMMGGAAFCPGNVTAVAEANIWGDPEAAQLIFQAGIPITMVGLDVTMQTTLSAHDLTLLDETLPYTKLVRDAVRFYMNAYESTQGTGPWCPLHDPLAVAVAADATLCGTKAYPVTVETTGDLTAGMTVIDARASSLAQQNADVCVTVDITRFLKRFKDSLGMK